LPRMRVSKRFSTRSFDEYRERNSMFSALANPRSRMLYLRSVASKSNRAFRPRDLNVSARASGC
jgi:hypothetical protein